MKWYETENGKEWLDSQSDIEQQYKDQQTRYNRGTVFLSSDRRYVCMLVTVDSHKHCLINLHTGNRWTEPIFTIHSGSVTYEEFITLCVGTTFTPIPFDITTKGLYYQPIYV